MSCLNDPDNETQNSLTLRQINPVKYYTAAVTILIDNYWQPVRLAMQQNGLRLRQYAGHRRCCPCIYTNAGFIVKRPDGCSDS